jgi:hypothetical protein
MKRTFLIALLALAGVLPFRSAAQEIQLNEDASVTRLVRNWVDGNRANPRIAGWQVQIMASTDRTQVEEGRTRFRSFFPGVPADWIHEKPYYKLRVGAFRTRMEALAFISTISDVFPGGYPAKEPNIHPRKFLE